MIELAVFAGRRRGGQELQRDFAVEPRVPGAEDFAERAATDALENPEVAPMIASGRFRSRVSRRAGFRRQDVAVNLDDRRHEPQVPDERPRGSAGARFGGSPVDRRAVEHGVGEVIE